MTKPSGPGKLLVCPTTHLDWDWLGTFAEYVEVGPPERSTYVKGTNAILTGVCESLNEDTTFCFSLAEISYLQEFLAANPDQLSTLISTGISKDPKQPAGPGRFALLGGGITSPDNLLCHGEVFIRNYLLGRRWLKSAGFADRFADRVAPVAWLPDDFGHDPQLPVVLEAMGLKWVGLSRVPGSPQPFSNAPIGGVGNSMAQQLRDEGLVFSWTARDGSQVVAHFMPGTYGGIWDGSGVFWDRSPHKNGLKDFVDQQNVKGWPQANKGLLILATVGGDFAMARWTVNGKPDDWLSFINVYQASSPDSYPAASTATFPQFMAEASGTTGKPRSPLLAQNYWTGQFATRPRLKMLHNRAAQLTLAAEAGTTLLRVISTYSTTTLDNIDAVIERAWEALVPSSHHDYITGTSPNRVYLAEQVPMLELAARLGEESLTQAVGLIAEAVPAGPNVANATSVVVFNPLGFARRGVVELPAQPVTKSVSSVSYDLTDFHGNVQRLTDGRLLIDVSRAAPMVDSFGYATVELIHGTPSPRERPKLENIVTLDNGTGVTAKIDRSKAWAITSLAVNGTQVLTPNGLGNSIRIYQDDGNIYQFGNEPLTGPGKFGKFADTATIMTGAVGEWIEWGPVRWHFRATITGQYASQPYSYTLDYLLHAGESVLRMRLTGAAPTKTSVLTRFDLGPAADGARYGLTYGTANHYDDNEPVPYWTGPTFRATHDFVQATGTPGPGLVIYHQAVPAWSIVDKVDKDDKYKHLLGALLRNPTGTERGAFGDDYGVHTLEYALGSAGNSQVTTGEALRTALTVTNPLVGAVIDPTKRADTSIALPRQASLAAITSTGTTLAAGILRAARTQAGHSMVAIPFNDGYYAERISFILRAYVPSPSPQGLGVTIALPSLPNPGTYGYDPDLRAALVTALEEPTGQQKGMTVSRTSGPGGAPQYSIQFSADRALATVQVTVTRSPTTPASGKDALAD